MVSFTCYYEIDRIASKSTLYKNSQPGNLHFLLVYLTNKEASTVLYSVVKHAGSRRARKKCRGKEKPQSSIFPYFLSALLCMVRRLFQNYFLAVDCHTYGLVT